MKTIRVLQPQVANRIAAGEVVERPASVVKELVENAIDAGATAVTVEIENGGIDSMRVSDNGGGIPPEDCATAFLRHATSKIAVADDIAHIHTLGFRGEALASIASVSQVTMKTRTALAESGTVVRIDNGELLENQPCACTEGTVMEVRNLFSKTPARLKFLKNARTEAGYIGDYMSRVIMSLPDVSFHYSNNGKTVYQTYGDGDLKNAVFCVYGASVLPYLHEVFYDDGYLRLTGYVGGPELARPNRMQQSLYLNARYIRSASISNAIYRAFDTRLMVGRFPFAVLFLRIASTEVDVNVHPAKMEVRFADERRVSSAVYSACVRALDAFAPMPTPEAPAPENESVNPDPMKQANTAIVSGPVAGGADRPALRMPQPAPSHAVRETFGYSSTGRDRWQRMASPNPSVSESVPYFQIRRDREVPTAIPDRPGAESFGVADYRIIGAAFSGYWIVEQGEDLFLIDQHAAHERRLYEQLMARETMVVSQPLLTPESVRLQPADFSLLLENLEAIEELGYILRLDESALTAELDALPLVGGSPLPSSSLFDALEMLAETGKTSSRELRRAALIQAACKHAVKVNERISSTEIERLLAEYATRGVPMTCPHGRPVMVRISKLELEKMFKRVL